MKKEIHHNTMSHNTDGTTTHHSEHEARVMKLAQLKALNIEPWAGTMPIDTNCADLTQKYVPESTTEYTIAGRIMTMRMHGKACFATVQDRTGKAQVYFKQDIIGEALFQHIAQLIDLGDIIWCKGTLFITKTNELTLRVTSFKLLSKCLYPLPEKFHGVSDIETKYRQRYLDLMTHEETRERFIKRSQIIAMIRSYLNAHDCIEVETPMLHPIPGGAAAKPFITHHNALSSDFYLRIAPELYLKRLVVGGFERVYEINRNFRNEGVSTRHNPEFTMLELYIAHQDYTFIMAFVENLFKKIALEICGSLHIPFGEQVLNFEKPFDRLTAQQALIKYAGLTQEELTPESIDNTLKKRNVIAQAHHSTYAQKIFLLFEELAESKLIQPTYIIDFPIEISPLARRSDKNPNIAARFELFIAGMEISNGFNELSDPFDQAARFKEQVEARESGDAEAMHYDADFVQALEFGLPPTVGVGIGIDRLVMLMTNTTSIKEVILFPTLKRK